MPRRFRNFVWNEFGVLAYINPPEDLKFLKVRNVEGKECKMSKERYRDSCQRIREKLEPLIGKRVDLRTSKNTRDWNEDIWFSDVRESQYDS